MREFMKWWLGHTEDEFVAWCSTVCWMAFASFLGLLIFLLFRFQIL